MGFEPMVRENRTHAFQACSLSHSDTSPHGGWLMYQKMGFE